MDEPQKRAGTAHWWVIAVAATLTLYVLAWGPYFYAAGRWQFSSPAVRVAGDFFAPLEAAVEYFPAQIRAPYAEYCRWWYHKGKKRPASFTTSIRYD